MTTRLAIGCVGMALAVFGVYQALLTDPDTWTSALAWLVAGVLLHDLVLAPVLVALGLILVRVLPRPWQAPAVVGGVVLGSLTLLAVPALGRFGADPTDPWLLDRPYEMTWWLLAAGTVLAVTLAGFLRSRRAPRRVEGASNTRSA